MKYSMHSRENIIMDKYEIIITPDAESDLNEIDDYITYTLLAPYTAISYLRDIRSHIAELSSAPKRFRLVEDEPWHSQGIRRMNAKNFAVFFYVFEEYSEVYIQNVIYQKRDITKVLKKLYPDLDEL